MDPLNHLADLARQDLEARNTARDNALVQARQLTRFAAHTIRAIHRNEVELAHQNLQEAQAIVKTLQTDLASTPDLYFAGYTQDAIKEYCEATLTCAIIEDKPLPGPQELGVLTAVYLNGLAETAGELRRRCLDILRQGYSPDAERLLTWMDEIYALMITLDYPDAITYGLRRHTDLLRGIVERTRADLTLSLREQRLTQALQENSRHFLTSDGDHADDPRL
ncbi:MAG TPA: haloacid dehalogenase [Longilinea sp.]|nr:haloacid dehalogenase [Longilinea sp.]